MDGFFPMWDMTPIARSRIIRRMKPEDIIELAIKSKPFYDFLKIYKLSVLDIECNLEKQYNLVLCFSDALSEIGWRYVRFYFPDENDVEPIKTDIKALERVRRADNWFFVGNYVDQKTKINAVEQIVKYLAEIIHVEKHTLLYWEVPGFEILNTSIFNLTKHFLVLSICGVGGQNKIKFTEEQLRFLIDTVNSDKLTLRCKLKDLDKLEHVTFNQKRLTFEDCDWLHPSALLNGSRLKYIDVDFNDKSLKLNDLIKLVVEWQKGEQFKNLVFLRVTLCNRFPITETIKVQTDNTVAVVP